MSLHDVPKKTFSYHNEAIICTWKYWTPCKNQFYQDILFPISNLIVISSFGHLNQIKSKY